MGKIYAVKAGRKTGKFYTWAECESQVKGFCGAEFKSFPTEDDADLYLYGGKKDGLALKNIKKFAGYLEKDITTDLMPAECVAYVDGSYNEASNKYGFGCVLLTSNKEYQLGGCDDVDYLLPMRNISGELLSAMVAVKLAKDIGMKSIVIYHDYEGIEKWGTGAWECRKQGTEEYRSFIYYMRKYINIDYMWVKGHSGNAYNNAADMLATKGLKDNIFIDSRKYFNGDYSV